MAGYDQKFGNKKSYSNDREKTYEFKFKDKGFTNDKGYLREELITEEAKKIAGFFKEDKLTKSQLRAFYNEVKALKNRLKYDKSVEKFDEIYPLILLMKAKIEYRASKDKAKMEGIKQFITLGIERVQKENEKGKGREAFDNFATLFETVVGYAYGMGLSE